MCVGFFDKLFGKSENSSSTANSMNDRADVWPAKFLTIAISETVNEAPGIDVVKEIIDDVYPTLSQSDVESITKSVCEMTSLVQSSDSDWDSIWDAFSTQLSAFNNSESFEIVKRVANTAFLLKMQENMQDIAENYTYRIGSHLEKYSSVSKSDFIAIMEEEKENTGYNEYLNDL